MNERALGIAEGSVRFNGHVWQIVRQGEWCTVEQSLDHEIQVEFHD